MSELFYYFASAATGILVFRLYCAQAFLGPRLRRSISSAMRVAVAVFSGCVFGVLGLRMSDDWADTFSRSLGCGKGALPPNLGWLNTVECIPFYAMPCVGALLAICGIHLVER